MTRFLFVMFQGGGNVPAQLTIAKRLVSRGHAVRVLGDPSLEAEARAASCTFAPFDTAPRHDLRDREKDLVRDWASWSSTQQMARFADELVFGPAERYARDVLGELERQPADVLAVDCLLVGALVGAERSGLPTAQLHHMPYSFPLEGVPPFGLGLHPARGVLGRLRDRVLGAVVGRTFEKLGRARVNAARASLGMAPLASVFDQVRRQQRVLVLTSRSFDFAGRVALPPGVVHVGPQLDDPAWTSPWTSPWPSDASAPLVLVALGSTFQDQRGATQRVIDALGALPVRGLVTTGGALATEDLTLPPNVVAVTSAPHHAVMPAAALVVCHGGHGTLMKGLSYGKPALCIPLGRDQADNAARVEVAGAGLRAGRNERTAALRAKLTRLLEEPSFAAAARRLAADIAEDVAANRAVTELESLAAAPGGPTCDTPAPGPGARPPSSDSTPGDLL